VRLFPYAVSRSKLERAVRDLRVPVQITNRLEDADLVLTLKAHERRGVQRLRDAAERGTPVHIVKSNTVNQLENFLRTLFGIGGRHNVEEDALREAEQAIDQVLEEGRPSELQPRRNYLRRLQHELAEHHGLQSESKGDGPYRRVVLYPPRH
jgi:predicted RNA-binding protein Jag